MSPNQEEQVVMVAEAQEDVDVDKGPQRTRRNKKVKVGHFSGLSDDQRRGIRRQQRDLNKKLQDASATPDDNFVDEARKENNLIFEDVKFTREAVLDAENVDVIVAKFAQQVDQLVQVPRYDATRLINKLKSKCMARNGHGGPSFFDWKTFGEEASICFNTIPSGVCFLIGPLGSGRQPEQKQKAVRQRRRKEEEEEGNEEEPEELAKKQKRDADQLSAAERTFQVIKKTFAKRSYDNKAAAKGLVAEMDNSDPNKKWLEDHGEEVDIVKMLFNPKSYTQTIENIFHFSFMIKTGDAEIKVRDEKDGLATAGVYAKPKGKPEAGKHGQTKQCIITLNKKNWKELCEACDVDKCDLPHRSTKLKRAPLSQMSQNST